MRRFAHATIRARESDDQAQHYSPAQTKIPQYDELEDRLGAQGSYLNRTEAVPVDSWTEIAQIVARLLKQQPAVEAEPALTPPTKKKAPKPEVTEEKASDASAEVQSDKEPLPSERATAPDNDPQMKFLAGDREVPTATTLEAPQFPKHKQVGKTEGIGSTGSGYSATLRRSRGGGGVAREGTPGEADAPEFIVVQWAGSVNRAGSALSAPKIKLPPDAVDDLKAKRKAAEKRNSKAREGLTEEAISNVPEAPEGEKAPPPPPDNPVPEHTRAILNASGRRLPEQFPPPLEPSPRIEDKNEPLTLEPKLPVIGEQAVPPDMFQVLLSPKGLELAQLSAKDVKSVRDEKGRFTPKQAKNAKGEFDPELARMQAAYLQLSNTGEVKVPKGQGEQIINPDTGPDPMPPLPPGLEVPVGQVVARLLAQTEQTSREVLDAIRAQAYPGGVLKKHFPDIGEAMHGDLSSQVNTELREIAAAANISADQLETMIKARRAELEASATGAKKEADALGSDSLKAAQEAGQQTMDAVDAAAKAAEEVTLRRQEAAAGSADPTVVKRRRDMTVEWIKTHVTEQTTNYQLAGEKRVKELSGVRKQQTEAYQALRQRLVFQIMNPPANSGRKPREPVDKAREQRLADLAAQLNPWEEDVLKRIGEMFRKAIKFIEDLTKTNRKDVEKAGSAGIEAARQWAEEKVLEGKGFWERLMARIRRWLSQADSLNDEWRVKRTRENRDAIAVDLQVIEKAKQSLAKGVDKETILEDRSLTEEQRDVIREFFKGRGALDIAADRLKQKIAASRLDAARTIFERELSSKPADLVNADKLNEIAQAMGDAGFSGNKIATEVHAAMDQWGTDEGRIFRNLKGLTTFKGMVVRKYYTANGWGDLDEDLDSELSGDEYRRAQAQIDGKVAAADAIGLHDALDRLNTDEAAVMDLLRNKTPEEIEAINAEYQSRYGKSLDQALKDDLDEGNELDQATALKNGDTATADAIAFDEAMRGGIISSGTDEDEIDRIQTRVREEVLAQSRGKRTAQEMEAEVRRRMKAIEDRFGERYGHVEQYNEPGLTGNSVLKRAFASELSGAELDLANAQQDNDLVKADAARVEIERTGFYASDDKLLKVMRAQYERALEARRLDEEPARRMVIQREVSRLRNVEPQLSEEEISKVRMRMEREMEAELDKGATTDAKLSTDALKAAYQGKYNRSLVVTLALNMSGREQSTALAILANDGKLSNLQEIELATQGSGADDDRLRATFAKMTKAEIEVARKDWERRHPGKDFYVWLRGQLSGRAESDIMDMAIHGAPESAMAQIEQEERRVKREREDLTGIVGEQVAGSEDKNMRFQLEKLQELKTDLKRTDWPPGSEQKREALMQKVEFRVQEVKDSVEDHRRKIDSVTDSIAQAASIVAAVVVGAIVTVLTAGMAAPAALALVALAASVAGTLATMATKRLVMGGAYGAKEFNTDLMVGIVDAVVSVATAGMGGKFMKLAKGVAGKLQVGRVASVITKPAAMIGGTLAKSPLAGTVARIGQSGLATKAMKAPIVGRALRSTGNTLGKAGRILSDPAEMVGASERFLAKSAENVVTSIPTTVTQLGMSDETWKGDPLANFVEGVGSGMWQAFYMGHIIGGPAELAQKSLVRGMHMRTEVGRMHLAGEMVKESFGAYREKNPAATVSDFLMAPEGRKLSAEIQRMGLLPTIESVNRRIAADPAAKAQQTGVGFDDAPTSKNQSERRVAQLEASLPPEVREKAFVTPDPELTGNTVRVEPVRVGDRIFAVEIRVGPDATPLDVAMHAATAHVMQKYAGISGRIFGAMEKFGGLLAGSKVGVGKRGWEAQLEMAKLPAIIDERVKLLTGEPITLDMAARLEAEIDALMQQFHEHEAIMNNELLAAQEGRGYVAAEDMSPSGKPIKKAATVEEAGPLRDQNGELTELAKKGLAFRLREAKRLLREARAAGNREYRTAVDDAQAASKIREAQKILRAASDAYELDYQMLYDHISTKGGHPDINNELRPAKQMPSRGPDVPAAPKTRHADQVELDKMLSALSEPDELGPSALVQKIRSGGPGAAEAQKTLNAQSSAPKNATVVDFSTAQMKAEFVKNGGVLQGGREGGKKVKMHGIEFFVYSPRHPKEGEADPARAPPPDVVFEAVLPRPKEGERVVYQFGDGELRVWFDENGLLKQEAIIGQGRERAGLEEQLFTHSEREALRAATERAHALGAGLRVESPFGISDAPVVVNQILQAKGIEAYMRRLRDALAEIAPGAALSYEVTVEFHERSMLLKRVEYRIDITVQGKRRPFAEFAIDVEAERVAMPSPKESGSKADKGKKGAKSDPRTHVLDVTAVVTDPLSYRYSHDSPALNALFKHLQESINIPQQVIHGLRFARPIHVLLHEVLSKMPADTVAELSGKVEQIQSHRPTPEADFDAKAWSDKLDELLSDRQTPDYIIIDLRDLGLSQKSIKEILGAIEKVPNSKRYRLILLQ